MEDGNLLDQIPDGEKTIQSDGKAYEEEASYASKSDQLTETKDDLKDARIQQLLSEIERYREDTSLRRGLASVFTVIIAFWLLSVILILVGNNCNNYNLSDTVLTALLVTSTANVIGMMLIILNNLFPSKDSSSKINSKKKTSSSKSRIKGKKIIE